MMTLIQAAQRKEHTIGKYRVVVLLDDKGNPIGAFVEGPRLRKPIYIAATERIAPRVPKNVKKLLKKYGFMIE